LADLPSTRREYLILAATATLVSVAAVVVYFRHDAILLYGDAVAHINIARRVFDSRLPGPSQLGTVWLPLPHVFTIPFIISDWMWQSGLGGSIPSMAAYVAGVLGIFRLLRRAMVTVGAGAGVTRLTAWFGAVVYGGNPNLIYLQCTAMNEPLYLAFFIWAVVYFADFVYAQLASQNGSRPLRRSGLMLMCAMLCRYDGWFAGTIMGGAALLVLALVPRATGPGPRLRAIRRSGLLVFALILAAAPAFWLIWNKTYFGNALEWMTGPYSAKAIMQRSMQQGQPPHPGYHELGTATVYFVKCARLNLSGENIGWGGARYGWPRRLENQWVILTVAGTVLLLVFARAIWPLLLLGIPLPFYALSIAYGGVPIFMPVWFPYSYYNVRYGLEMLPLASVAVALTVGLLCMIVRRRRFTIALTIMAVAAVGTSYTMIWTSGPVCLHEAEENSRIRVALERRVGKELQTLPPQSTFLMQIGYYVGVLQRAGIPLKRTINETDFDLWENALADPAHHADFLIAAGNDRVAACAREHAAELESVTTFEAEGQPTVVLYRRRK
jgi:hypothetical protein